MGKYTHSDRDAWQWRKAIAADVPDIVALVDANYSAEIDSTMFTKNATRLHYHLHLGILEQTFNLNTKNITVAIDRTNNRLLAWAWIERGEFTIYSDDEMASGKFSHVDLSLSLRTKITLVAQIIEQWILWCTINSIPVLCSATIRAEQAGFMRLHDQFGFVRRGSFAYRKIDQVKIPGAVQPPQGELI